MNTQRLSSFIVLLFISTSSFGQSFSMAGGIGQAEASAAMNENKKGTAWYLSATMSFGMQDEDVGGSFFLGVAGQGTDAGETEQFGSLSIFEYMVPFGYAFRWKRTGFIAYGEWRNTIFTTSNGFENSDGDFLFTGAGVRVPLGPTGTTLGRAGMRVLYGTGGGGFFVPGTFQVREEVTIKELKVAVEYPFTSSFIGRVEYRNSDYSGDGNSPLFDQDINTLMVVGILNF